MPIKIYIDPQKIEGDIMENWNKNLPHLTDEIREDCNEFCKYDKGILVESSEIHSEPEKGIITWETPYAKRQYYEIKTAHKKEGHPNATWRWFHKAKAKKIKEWKLKAQRCLEGKLLQ